MGSKRGIEPRTRLSKENLLQRGVPEDYIEGTLKDYVQSRTKRKVIKEYLENIHDMYENRQNLIFYGSNGSGKTFLASLIVKHAYLYNYSSYMTTVAHLMDITFRKNKTLADMRDLELIKSAEFLVIDELGKENDTQTASNINLIEELLRGAVVRGQVVIICTNLHIDKLYERYGASMKSLISGSFIKLKFEGEDYRPQMLNRKKATKLLRGEKV